MKLLFRSFLFMLVIVAYADAINATCREEISMYKSTIDKLMKDLEYINTIPKLISWYHNKSKDMYVCIYLNSKYLCNFSFLA